MQTLKNHLAWLLMVAALNAVPALASERQAGDAPSQLIEETTTRLIQVIESHQEDFPANEDSYFKELDDVVDGLVDFDFIAMNVMGNYRRNANDAQIQSFVKTFRRGLVETYGRGLINFSNQNIVLVPGPELEPGQHKTTVRQEIRSIDAVYPLEYTMAQKKSGDWKVINVIINGINLGKTFRNQFMQLAQKSGGDIDKVIAGWRTESV